MSQMTEEVSRAVLEADVQIVRRALARGSGFPAVYYGYFVPDRVQPPWEATFVTPWRRADSWQGYRP
ncbi:MAG: hypothetical protein ABW167_07670 [Baekduia sp.]